MSGPPIHRPSPWTVAPRCHVVDVVLALTLFVPTTLLPGLRDKGLPFIDVVSLLAAIALFAVRRRWPIPVLGAGLVTALAITAVAGHPTTIVPAIVVLIFAVAVQSDRRTSVLAGVVGLAVMLVCVFLLTSFQRYGPEVLAGIAWPTLAVAAGQAIRNQREAITSAEQRAWQIEQTHEEEARRRVVEERLHIARELHDAVAHRIAVVNVQAGVAAHLLRSDPDGAHAALSEVRSSASTVLDELAEILGVLRSSDTATSTGLDPTPMLDSLPVLVDSFRSAGLTVRWASTGAVPDLSDAVSLAVYRTVQEGLTNAHKHGDGSAVLTTAAGSGGFEVTIDNATRGESTLSERTGFGLIGMRERVSSVGGELSCGPTSDGQFHVRAVFPVKPPTTAIDGGAP